MDLKDRFDQATSGGPSHAPLESRIHAGRRAVRRRSAGRALGATVVAATVLVGVSTLSTGQDRATKPVDPAVATQTPTPTPTPTQTAQPQAFPVVVPDKLWEDDEWARMNPRTGEVVIRSGVTVANSLDPAVQGFRSVALDVTLDGERRYVLLVRRQGIVSLSWDDPAGRTLREFVADKNDPLDSLPIAMVRGTLGADLPLVGYKDGELYTVGGAEIVRVVENPIKDWCAPNATAAVELLHEGVTYFAVLGDGNCGGGFNKFGDVPSLEAVIGRVSSNIDWALIRQGERDRKELEREIAEKRKQSDRK